ncbi:MAG: enoyl-CoA hydratase/isomerase family protein [Actinobacteria bacterium]|nr:enoyl-CoA hydratase/isomerase family protein [Actinomycetota bacterium]
MAVHTAAAGAVATVTLDNPAHKNAITDPMWGELEVAFRSIARDASIRVVVVTGSGSEFCSGADLTPSRTGVGSVHATRRMEQINQAALALHELPQPSIARVDGVAAGAGANLALGCDLVVASDRSRFTEIFTKRGLSVDFGGSWLLPRLVGVHKAMELCLLADIVDAAEAERIGLVNRVVPADRLDDAVATWVDRLLQLPPIAATSVKRLVHDGADSTFARALAAEGMAQAVNFSTKDTAEAMVAFVERRDPEFRGR